MSGKHAGLVSVGAFRILAGLEVAWKTRFGMCFVRGNCWYFEVMDCMREGQRQERADWWQVGGGRRAAEPRKLIRSIIECAQTVASPRQPPACLSFARPSSTLDVLQRFATSATTPSGRCTRRMSQNGTRLHIRCSHCARTDDDDDDTDKLSGT
jgi:hypothetical protein